MRTVETLRTEFAAAKTDDERTKLLFAAEDNASEELITFLLEVASDRARYDLTRIEAIKAAGLSATTLRAEAARVADVLVKLAIDDPDSDIQNYALQYLRRFPELAALPVRVAPALASDRDYDVRFAAYNVLASQSKNPDAIRLLRTIERDADLGEYARDTLREGGHLE